MFQEFFGLVERTRNDVNTDELADATSSNGAGFGCGLHGADIAANENRDVAVEEVLLPDQNNVRGFHHRIGCLNCSDESACFDHPQGFVHFLVGKPGAYGSKNAAQKQLTGLPRFHMIFRKSKENGALAPDMTNFGASFKKARESRALSLDQIAAETRISTRFLLAIENEEFHLLPGGIFNRGFVRSYAEKIGLDPEQAVADYERLAEIREPAEPAIATASQPRRRERSLYPIAIGGLILLIIIFYVVTRESSNTVQTASAPAPVATPPPAQPQPVEPALPGTPPATTSAAPEPGPPPAAAPATPPPPAALQAVRIDMDVKATTWIKVEADGSTVNPSEILEPGMTRHFAAQKSIVLIIGNAGGLTLKINDMPAKNLGKSGQVRELKITPANIKDFTG
jgi:cytoskeleton protein RodZ